MIGRSPNGLEVPEPHWGWFAIAVALVAVIEWEEFSLGYLRRGRFDPAVFCHVVIAEPQ